jgi:hypothetical protein
MPDRHAHDAVIDFDLNPFLIRSRVRAFLTKDFPEERAMAPLAAPNDSEQTADEVDNLIPYTRFLERRAWREKIAADHHRLEHERIDIQAGLGRALAAEDRELTCPICPKKLRYVTTRNVDGYVDRKHDSFRTVADVHVYECASHGRFHVGPNGRLSSGS